MKVFRFLKKEPMLTLSVIAAVAGLIITPPSAELLVAIDWRTLGTLLSMLLVLEGFKKEDVFAPLVRLASKIRRLFALALFLIFCVFFSSMFVTNDVSLLIFVPLAIIIFRGAGKEEYILPVISLMNIAAIRGSMLTPFGSPQNLFLFGRAEVGAGRFILHMLPLSALSAVLLVLFVLVVFRRDLRERDAAGDKAEAGPWRLTPRRAVYLSLFLVILFVIVSRTRFWYAALAVVVIAVLIADRTLCLRVDWVLLLTFLCFFVFSSSIAKNETIASFLGRTVAGREYWWAIGLSQIISNVPAGIVLYPFSSNFAGLIYGLDTAGLVSVIGSLASVINYRIYVREYPGKGKKFLLVFTLVSWAFFLLVVLPGYFLSRWPFIG